MKASEIAELVGGELFGDGSSEVMTASEFATAKTGDLAFTEKAIFTEDSMPGCLIAPESFDEEQVPGISLVKVKDPKLAFALAVAVLYAPQTAQPYIHPSTSISDSATIGIGCSLDAFVSIGADSVIGDGTTLNSGARIGIGVKIGQNCRVHPNVTVEDGCTIGDNVILHAGVVLGADGFGYVRDESGEYQKFPQIGTVVIEDNVEIGANSCVDRAALGVTRIGRGTKIDNLVQVGHNVDIGKRCVIAAQTGISGSVLIEDDCVIGGQVGFGDHVRVLSGTVIGSQAGILPGKIVRPGVYWGTPIQPLADYKRQNANLKGIGRLKEEVRRLRDIVEDRKRKD